MSVILLMYKNQNRIKETIQSILDQDYPDIEIIISDDASGVFEKNHIINYIEDNKRDNIRNITIRQNMKNLGTVAHMNLTANLSKGKYIKFISCGDKFYEKSALTKLYEFIEEQGCSVVTSMSAVCSEDFSRVYYYYPSRRRVKILNKYYGRELFYILSFSNIISAIGCLFKDSFFRQEGGFDESYRLLEDYPTWLRISRMGGRIPCLNEVSTYYTIGGVSSISGTSFESEALKTDMTLCFGKEIMPYINEFPSIKKHFTLYQYLILKSNDNFSKKERKSFKIKYFPFILYRNGKAIIKKMIKKIGRV